VFTLSVDPEVENYQQYADNYQRSCLKLVSSLEALDPYEYQAKIEQIGNVYSTMAQELHDEVARRRAAIYGPSCVQKVIEKARSWMKV
jgi:hypothetical protein